MQCIAKITLLALSLVAVRQPILAQLRGRAVPGRTGQHKAGLARSASSQANCKDVKGILRESWDGGPNSPGTLSKAGFLNGTTIAIFTSEGFATPIPSQFSYTGAYTITTGRGELKGTRTFLTDIETGWATDLTIIDPKASTGIFAGATGVLYSNALEPTVGDPPSTYLSEIFGQVCLAQ